MLKNVLITGIGGDIAQGVAAIVRESFPSWRIVGMDIHDRHGGALFVDTLHRAPRVSDADAYDRWLDDLLERERIDICIPMSEAELAHLAGSARWQSSRAAFVMANPEAIAVGTDKFRTFEFLGEAGVARPWTVTADAFDPRRHLPCVFKARRSAGSKAVFVCTTAEEVAFHRQRHPFAIVQELLLPADAEVTCAVFRSRAGDVAVLQLLRSLTGGFTGWAEVIDDPDITAQCRRIAETLPLRGSINLQLRLTAHGPRIFEMNPRFSSTALMRHRMGFQDVVWSLQEQIGEPVTFSQPAAGTRAVRVQEAALLPLMGAGRS